MLFKKELRNGEVVDHEWLIYSPSQRNVCCFVCKLFSSTSSTFNSSEFNAWKQANMATSQHENSPEHRKCMMSYHSLLQISSRVNSQLSYSSKMNVKEVCRE
ncbi:hypothetical protein X975_23805, partial [Stegodyphus mimosarum]